MGCCPSRHQDENLASRENFKRFRYDVLRKSTRNFDKKNLLGEGGFSVVYKGKFLDGSVVAVKKLKESQFSQDVFLSEVEFLCSVRHRNLVRLLGYCTRENELWLGHRNLVRLLRCCTQKHERLLVYEFMSNNSLQKHLFEHDGNSLSWTNRFNIISGIADGLAYLHTYSDKRIIHRDIKCANILLDDNYHPKIADFGLAKFFPEDKTHVSTKFGGTPGYLAPEYFIHGQLTEKADVYSYGVVVLEIITGKKFRDASLADCMESLVIWAWNQFGHDQVLDIVDSSFEGQYPREQALRVIKIALLCTQGSSALRPAMSEVVSLLKNNSEIPTVRITERPFRNDAAASPANFTSTSDPTTPGSPPAHGSHGSIPVSISPRSEVSVSLAHHPSIVGAPARPTNFASTSDATTSGQDWRISLKNLMKYFGEKGEREDQNTRDRLRAKRGINIQPLACSIGLTIAASSLTSYKAPESYESCTSQFSFSPANSISLAAIRDA